MAVWIDGSHGINDTCVEPQSRLCDLPRDLGDIEQDLHTRRHEDRETVVT